MCRCCLWEAIAISRPSVVLTVAVTAALAAGPAATQTAPKQVHKPPIAQAWIYVATFSGMNVVMGGGEKMSQTLSSLMGGAHGAKAEFGYTETGTAGRMDVTLYTSRNTGLVEALQMCRLARDWPRPSSCSRRRRPSPRRSPTKSRHSGIPSPPRTGPSYAGAARKPSGPDNPRSWT